MNESRLLLTGTIFNAAIGCIGLYFFAVASSQAILLDGLFNLTYFITGLFTLKVARMVKQGDDAEFPFGYAAFEPLVNGVKGVLVLGVTLSALVGAVEALVTGGRSVNPGPAIIYGIIATIGCLIPFVVLSRGAKRTGSPLVKADAENWLVNAGISSVVLLAFLGIYLVEGTEFQFVAPYIDPALVLLVVAVSISVPVRLAWGALLELLNRTPDQGIIQEVTGTVQRCISELPVQDVSVRVIQPGRTRMVLAHIVLPKDYEVGRLETFDTIRSDTQTKLRGEHEDTMIDMVFTADPRVNELRPS